MERLLGSKAVPLGLRFQPTDEELFMYYLKRKVKGKSLKPEMISEVDVYQFAPWDLPAMSFLKTRDLNWFFFCPRSKKYPNGGRVNRATAFGYWKSTGNDRSVSYRSRTVGKIKTLIFHCGKAPSGERTDWVMHEYRLEDTKLVSEGVTQDSYVICKLYQKSGLGPKNGETYGAHFVEEEWESDDDDNVGGEVVSESCDVTPSVLTFAVDGSKTAYAVGTLINAAPTTSGDTSTSALTHAATTSAPAPTTSAPATTIAAATTSVASHVAATTSAAATTSVAAHAAATTSATAHAAATTSAAAHAAATTSAAAHAAATTSAAAHAAATTSAAAHAAATTSAAAHAAATTSAAAHAAATTSAAPISAAAATDFDLGDFVFSDEELKMALEQFIPNEMDISHLWDDLGGPPQMGTEWIDHGLYLQMDDLK